MIRFLLLSFFIIISCEDTLMYPKSDFGTTKHTPSSISILPENNSSSKTPSKESFQKGEKDLPAVIIGIKDGDTVEILYYELPISVRLQHIDAPEKRNKQAFGNAAKKVLSDLCFGKNVYIRTDAKFDRNGRLLGEVIAEDGTNINREMVFKGYAWHYKKYSDDNTYAEAEDFARKNKLGLWADKNPIAPWDFRKK